MPKSFSDGFFEDSWLGLVQRDPATGFLSSAGSVLTDAHVSTTADLVALNTTTYNNQSVMVDNPAGNTYGSGTVAGIPARAYCYNSAWHWENGCIILGIYAEALQLTVPAATFTSAAATNNGSGLVKLTSAGAHGLTAANAITIPCKIRITGGTGWTPGDYSITAITLDTTGTDFTINYTWPGAAILGTPTIVLASSNEIEIVRCKIPVPLTTRARVELDGSIFSPVNLAGAFQTKFYLGASGAAYGASTNIWIHNLASSASIDSIHSGIQLQNSRSVQKTIFNITSLPAGLGNSTTDATSAAVDMSAVTDMFVTTIFTTANRPMRYDGFIWKMYDA